jgi:hypothetical protein
MTFILDFQDYFVEDAAFFGQIRLESCKKPSFSDKKDKKRNSVLIISLSLPCTGVNLQFVSLINKVRFAKSCERGLQSYRVITSTNEVIKTSE